LGLKMFRFGEFSGTVKILSTHIFFRKFAGVMSVTVTARNMEFHALTFRWETNHSV